MKEAARFPLILIVGYLTYRITTEFIDPPVALGVLAGVAVWLATGPREQGDK